MRGHHKAMPFDQVPGFAKQLRKMPGIAPAALEFAILTAARSGEVLGCRWDEIDLTERVWTIPAARMKGGREHRVPLSACALQILKSMQARKVSEHVFPGSKADRPLSVMALEMVMRRAKIDATVRLP